jgi:hypothetical protein
LVRESPDVEALISPVCRRLKSVVEAKSLPDLQVRRFPEIHHFVMPEEVYTKDHLRALSDL